VDRRTFAAIAIVLRHAILVGVAPQADEGLEAHLWQLLIAGQLPLIALFALRWLPRRSGQALLVLAVQGAALVVAITPIRLLNW
jgi:hypothetical protein